MSSLPLNWKNQHHKEDDLIVLSIFSIIRVNFINFLNLFLISKLVCRRILLRTVPVCDIISKKSIQNQMFQISYKFSNPWHYLRIFDKSASFYKLFSVKNQNLSIFHIPYGCQQMKIFAFKCEIQFPFLFRKLFRENEFSRKKQKRCEILWKKNKTKYATISWKIEKISYFSRNDFAGNHSLYHTLRILNYPTINSTQVSGFFLLRIMI